MKAIIKSIIFILALINLATSCSPEKRLHRLLALHPELVQNDTIRIIDTTIIPGTKIDTVVHESRLRDTITITKEKLTVKIHRLRDTIYISAQQEADTIIITKEIPIERIISKKPEPFFNKMKRTLMTYIVLSLFSIFIFLLILYFIRHR